jgi:DNA polymerase
MNNSLRHQYLEAIGIQSWQLKSNSDADFYYDIETIDDAQNIVESIELVEPAIVVEPHITETNSPVQGVSESVNVISDNTSLVENTSLERKQKQSISANNVPELLVEPSVEKLAEVLVKKAPEPVNIISDDVQFISELEQAIRGCKKCPKRQTRLNALSGYGNDNASIFIISEAPTAEEDRSAHYLTDETTSLLQSMFQSIDAKNDFFYTGIIKCYSLTDFLLTDEEVNHCAPYLYTQIEHTRPSVIVLFGAVQAQTILKSKKTFNELRGMIHHITINSREYPVVVTYHPSYLLRNPQYKREALCDLIMIKKLT